MRNSSHVRIAENTPSRLVLRDRTLWISAVCFIAAAALVGHVAFDLDDAGQLVPAALSVLFGLAFLRATDVTFDKTKSICLVRRFDVLRLTRKCLAFHDILDVRLDIDRSYDSDDLTYRLSLSTKSAVIPLSATYEPGFERYSGMREAVLDAVFKAAQRPTTEDPISDLVKAGRVIDAVAIIRMREGLSLTEARAGVAELQRTLK
jgi:hypothetical protein